MVNKTSEFILNAGVTRILKTLRTTDRRLFKYKIAKKVNGTYSHVSRIVTGLTDIGLIISEKEGRRTYTSLTTDGISIADNILKIE